MSVIPQTPRASGGLRPLGPLPGFCPGPAGELSLAYSRPPLTTNPGSAPELVMILTQDNRSLFRCAIYIYIMYLVDQCHSVDIHADFRVTRITEKPLKSPKSPRKHRKAPFNIPKPLQMLRKHQDLGRYDHV
jgi:hypothetical protein